MESSTFPKHERPNTSRLEAFRQEIVAMRREEWPYARIANWLLETKAFSISAEGVRQFCCARQIGKGGEEAPIRRLEKKKQEPIRDNVRKFDFDETRPIQTRKNH